MTILSDIETSFTNLLSRVQCMSMEQAYYILKSFFHCSDKACGVIIRRLKTINHLTITANEQYILHGSQKSHQKVKINRGNIECLYYALNHISTTEELSYMYLSGYGSNLTYISDGQMYQVVYLKENEFSKIKILESKYLEEKRKAESKNQNYNNSYFFQTICIFAYTKNIDEYLNHLNMMDIEMPHTLAFLNREDTAKTPVFNCYSTNS